MLYIFIKQGSAQKPHSSVGCWGQWVFTSVAWWRHRGSVGTRVGSWLWGLVAMRWGVSSYSWRKTMDMSKYYQLNCSFNLRNSAVVVKILKAGSTLRSLPIIHYLAHKWVEKLGGKSLRRGPEASMQDRQASLFWDTFFLLKPPFFSLSNKV